MFQAIFDDCKASLLTVLICMAIDHCWVLVTTWLAITEVSVAIWMIAVAQIIVLGVVVAVAVTVIDGDMVVYTGGSRCVEDAERVP